MATRQTVPTRRTCSIGEPVRTQAPKFQWGFNRNNDIYIRSHWIFTKRSSAIPTIGRRIG